MSAVEIEIYYNEIENIVAVFYPAARVAYYRGISNGKRWKQRADTSGPFKREYGWERVKSAPF